MPLIYRRLLLAGSALLLLGSCKGLAPLVYDEKNFEINDPTLGLTRSDYRNLPFSDEKNTANESGGEYEGFKTNVSKKGAEPPIPDVAPILAAPSAPKLGQTKLVSLAVTDDVPLKDVFLELSRLADVDIEVDANITGGVAFRANQKPFNEVIDRLCDFAGLRYSMKDGVLRVERDQPYVEIYTLDFLNYERSSSSSVNISTSVLSGGGGGGSSSDSSSSGGSSSGGSSGGGGGALSTGSSSSISSSSENDFWQQFEVGINNILAYVPQQRVSEFGAPPAQTSASAASDTQVANALSASPGASTTPSSTPAPSAAPSAASSSSSGSSGTSASGGASGSSQYNISKQAGTMTVVATAKQHRLIKEFIKTLEYNASAQVLIEAKIIEVTLNENFQAGIDWNRFGGNSFSASTVNPLGSVTNPDFGTTTFNFTKNNLTGLDIDLNVAVELAQQFGTTRTLSSPRLHAINNQQAVMTFAKNEIYFTITVEKEEEDTTTSSQTTYVVNSTVNTIPIGIIMTLLPSINRATGEVTMNIRPTLSRILEYKADPGLQVQLALNPDLGDLSVESEIPVVEVRELDSTLKVKSGQVMVIGGLMDDAAEQTDTGIPGAQDIPVLGNLFKGISRERATRELIIFIRPTIVGEYGSADSADKRLYEKFTQDPRPLNF